MHILEIQKSLRSGTSFDDLLSRYGIITKRHRVHGNLVLFKYNQIASPMAERIVQECRGIILDEAHNWAVVSRAFDKFFNYGEGHAACINWATARVQEKVDGSLCTLYRYDGGWHVATTGTPDASGDLHLAGRTFASMFWEVFGELKNPNPAYAYYFELTSPFNRIVVRYAEPRLTLLGARHVESGQEVRVEHAWGLLGAPPHIALVRECTLAGIDGIIESFTSMSPLSQEGYVVVDDAFNRIKVKHPGYVALHHAKDGLSQRAFVDIARSGETPEVIAAFPEFRPMLDDAKGRLDRLVAEVDVDFSAIKDIPIQRDFALKATKTRCPAALFAVRAGKAPSVREHFAGVHVDQLMKLLGYGSEQRDPDVES